MSRSSAPSSRATVYDVAREAGVSIKTVSRVVNGSDAVTSATRERVMAAVRRLKYVPNSNALSLKAGRSRTVGLVVDSLADPFFAAIVAIVESKLVTAGYTVLVAATNRQADREREQVIALTRHRIAGLILAPVTGDHRYLSDVLHGIPVVMIDRDTEEPGYDVVRVDDRAITGRAVSGLLEAGHRRIAFIGDSKTLPTSLARYRGYLDAHAAAGVPHDWGLERWEYDLPDQAAFATKDLLELADPPTALFCAHPRSAVGAVRTLHRTGNTGRALISFGDVELGELLDPALTVIDHRPELLAEAAADLLVGRLRGAAGADRSVPLSGMVPETAARDGTSPRTDIVIPLDIIRRGSGELSP